MEKQAELRSAVLDILSYYAVLRWPVSEQEIFQLLPIRTNQLAVRDELSRLGEQTIVVKKVDYFQLEKYSYFKRASQEQKQALYLARARRWAKFFGLLPFVRSVLVVNSASFGVVHKNSDIDLMVVTDPNRIYITKGILMYGLMFLGQLETEKKKAMRFSLGMFITTNGVNMKRDVMKINQPHLWYWLMAAKPVWGADVWYDLLKRDPLVATRFPNRIWPKTNVRIPGTSWRLLDSLDNKGYRRHLRHSAAQAKNQKEQAFVRIRPDIINLHARSGIELGKIVEKYDKVRSNYS